MPIQPPVKNVQSQANQAVFESISKNGLCATSKIRSKVLVNHVTQTPDLFKNICVNYVNLTHADENARRLALETAVLEEYCGIYGISLERQWPFQRFENSDLFKQEAVERLMNCVVFVLNPPTLGTRMAKPSGAQKACEISFYEHEHDEPDDFAHQRDKNLLTGRTHPYTHRVTEIKTTHTFLLNEMQAILAPLDLVDDIKHVFKGINVIPVPDKPMTFRSIPDISKRFHNEAIKEPITLTAPDFLEALLALTAEKSMQKFSIHAVRLNTTFDFTLRPIAALSKHKDLFKKVHAQVFAEGPDDFGWAIVHKNYGVSKAKLLEHLTKTEALPPDYLSNVGLAMKPFFPLFDELSKAKGALVINNVYANLSKPQTALLEKMGVSIVQHHEFYVLSHLPTIKQQVLRIVDDFNSLENQSATKIQASFRGFWTRRVIEDVKNAKHQLALAKEVLDRAEDKLNQLNSTR